MDKPRVERTSVTISKDVHRELKIAAARLGVTQRDLLEAMIVDTLGKYSWSAYTSEKKEE